MIRYTINSLVAALATPPIAEVRSWASGPENPEHGPLLDVSQAVPGYGPAQDLLDPVAERIGDPATARPGNQVILVPPWYFNHHMSLQMRGIDVRYPRFNPDGEPGCDVNALPGSRPM